MRLTTLLFIVFGLSTLSNGQNIFINEAYDDWTDELLAAVDGQGDVASSKIDIDSIWITNDQKYFYVSLDLNKEISLQDDNDLTIYIDTDNNINTGRKINGIGAEFAWHFGDRFGESFNAGGGRWFVDHESVDLMLSPTVTSSRFEIGMLRKANFGNFNLNISGEIAIRIEDNSFNGDEMPDDLGGFTYTVSEENNRDFQSSVNMTRSEKTDIRILSYNILNDNLFASRVEDEYDRILKAINPDIIGFQEIRDFNGAETTERVRKALDYDWEHRSGNSDIVLLSRFPIVKMERVNGNSAFHLKVKDKDLVVINVHFPCCDRDVDRQREIDNMISYIGKLHRQESNIKVEAGSPIILIGDTNLVGFEVQQRTLITGDIQNNATYGDDVQPDWGKGPFTDVKPIALGTPYSKTYYSPTGSYASGRLDYIIYTPSAITLDKSFVLSSRDLSSFNLSALRVRRDDTDLASDHLPLVGDFSLGTVSTEEWTTDIKLYPNPTTGPIHLPTGVEILSVVNTQGQHMPVVRYKGGIDLSNYPTGSYFLKVILEGKISTQKVIKL